MFLTISPSTCIVLGLIITFVQGHDDWNYEKNDSKGIDNWGDSFPKCRGKKQSPVNINTNKVKVKTSLSVKLGGVSNKYETWIRNNGHSVQLSLLDSPTKPNITGNAISGTYEFAQLHFHWGSSSNVGSEHSINGKFYSAELHLVFAKKDYCSPGNATNYDDGLVVVGVFLKGSSDNNQNLDPLIYAISRASDYNAKAFLPTKISFSSLLPKDTSKFYTYNGSLTSPDCSEAVTWILMAEPVEIGEQQLETLRSTRMSYTSKQTRTNQNLANYRTQVALNSRTVRASFDASSADDEDDLHFSFSLPMFRPMRSINRSPSNRKHTRFHSYSTGHTHGSRKYSHKSKRSHKSATKSQTLISKSSYRSDTDMAAYSNTIDSS